MEKVMAKQTHRSGRRWAIWMAAGVGLVSAFISGRAYAWSGTEHIRFPDQAYQVMNILRRNAAAVYATETGLSSLTTCPASICTPAACPSGCGAGSSCAACAQWNRFIAQTTAAPPKLDNIRTDLSDFKLKAPDCDNLFPVLGAGGAGAGGTGGSGAGGSSGTSTPGQLAQCRAGDIWFAPRRGWGGDNSDNDCFLRAGYMSGGADQHASTEVTIRPFFQDLPSNFTGAVLGEWATGPDDYNPDLRLWVRPSSVLFESELTGLSQDAVDVGLAIIVAPVFCLADLLFGGGDCIDDAENFSHDVDPVTWIDEGTGLLELETVGQLTVDSGDWPLKGNVSLPAMFHFASVANSGSFNHIPGYQASAAGIGAFGGPNGWSVLDMAIVALGDLTGLTVQPEKSDGVSHYSQYADGPETRLLDDWIISPVGHAEMEPVYNLAKWGWDSFTNGSLGAKGIGWVLHAIGDADQPHHTAGTCGYGHQPWEKFALLNWQTTFQELSLPKDYKNMQAIVGYAFHWWKFLDDAQTSQHTTQLPVRDMIRALAVETSQLPVSTWGHAFQEANYLDTPNPDDSDIHATFDGESANMLDLMERTIGASMGFLTKASDYVPTVTPGSDPCSCPVGSSRFAQTAAGDLIPAANGACTECGNGTFQTLPVYADGECLTACPANEPTLIQGVCSSSGGACPASAPFSQDGTCVKACKASLVVVNNYKCQPGPCPTGTNPSPVNGSFCNPIAPKTSPAVCGPVNGDSQTACCGSDHGLCGTNNDCCSHGCRGDGICLAETGNGCDSNDDCLSGSCVNGICGQGHPGSTCAKPSDCLSGQCPTSLPFVCPPGAAGTSCSAPTDCLSGDCGSSGVCLGATGEPCGTQNSLCIYGLCLNGACAGGPGDSCGSQPCGVGELCSGLTSKCCGQPGVLCKTDVDCCSTTCGSTEGSPGTCTTIIAPG
jgi:hypothetical protein